MRDTLKEYKRYRVVFASGRVCIESRPFTYNGAHEVRKAYSQVWGFTTWIEEV